MTSEQIFESLAQRISRGVLAPGERLLEQPLSREFGVSRTPLREAIIRLEQAGLIERQEPRGYVVAPLTLARIDNIYSVRIALEELAVSLAAHAVGTPAFERLLASARAAAERTDDDDDPQLREQFHERLASLSGNGELLRLLRDLDLRIYAARRLDWQVPERAREAQREHLRILELLERDDVSGAREAMRQHIDVSRSTVRALMRQGVTAVSFASVDG